MNDPHNVTTLHRAVRDKSKHKILKVLSKVSQEDLKVADEKGETVLHMIFANENLTEKEIIEFLTAFLDRGADVNAEDRREKTALHRAIQRRMKGAVDLLVRHGADIYICDYEGNSIAHEFVRDEITKVGNVSNAETEAESASFVEFLIEKGFNYFDFQNEMGTSAIHLVIEHNLQHILHVLVRRTRDVFSLDRRNKSLLHFFLERRGTCRSLQKDCKANNASQRVADILKILLDRGVSTWSRDSDKGRTCVQVAIECKEDMSIIEMLVDHRLESLQGNLATDMFAELLESCAWWGKSRTEYFLKILRSLIAEGADVNAKDKNGTIPAYHALQGRNVRAVDFLDEHGADFAARNEDGENLYHALARLGILDKQTDDDDSSKALFDFIVSKGCRDVNARNSADETPLHWAARCGNLAIACKLVESGAEVNGKDANGCTPLHHAVCHSTTEKLTELLLENGADVNCKDSQGRRPLALAVDVSDADKLVPLLLKRGAFVNAFSAAELPLRRTIARDKFRLARKMLAYGADVNNAAVVDSLLRCAENERSWNDWWDRKFLLQHWMRLRAAKLLYSRKYEVDVDPRVHQECLKEVKVMKDTFIGGRTSIYSFLHMDFGRRRRHMNSEKLRQLVHSPDLKKKFPNYSVVILASYRETVLWKSLLEPAKRAWLQLTNIKLPEECIEIIFAHLRNEDLVSMIEHDEVEHSR